MPRIQILAPRCRKCGLCVEICPEELFVRKDSDSTPRVIRQRACIACGHCVSTCPGGAIVHQDFPPDELPPRSDL